MAWRPPGLSTRIAPAALAGSCRRWLSSRTRVGAQVEGRRAVAGVVSGVAITPPAPCPSCRRARARAPSVTASSAPGQHGDRPVLGGHRHPLVGLGHHRRLAGDRVAQHREPVGACRPRRCRSRRGRQGSPRAPARASPPRASARSGSRRRPRCRCRSGSGSPRVRSVAAQAVVVRQRAVVDQAQVEPGGERVRVLGGDPALGRHPRVAERVAAGDLGQREARARTRPGARPPCRSRSSAPGAHQRQLGMVGAQPGLDLVGLGRDHERRRGWRAPRARRVAERMASSSARSSQPGSAAAECTRDLAPARRAPGRGRRRRRRCRDRGRRAARASPPGGRRAASAARRSWCRGPQCRTWMVQRRRWPDALQWRCGAHFRPEMWRSAPHQPYQRRSFQIALRI